jgi:hypothetical protein
VLVCARVLAGQAFYLGDRTCGWGDSTQIVQVCVAEASLRGCACGGCSQAALRTGLGSRSSIRLLPAERAVGNSDSRGSVPAWSAFEFSRHRAPRSTA